ncbi:aldo/keto reductase [Lysobacter enzymogenes]|uniref:aldo/keto reductase n=1 Tax=Lysobacter enzymogenes TaxID=69 RepID=UPI00099BF39D|nr:aldo/keto reductase [Lysobacter enzymogenes]UZW61510.1 aldo/keto reductase [Lysobacter enzymogenes]
MSASESLTLSPIVAGCWRMAEWKLDAAGRLRWIAQAVELGIDSFDHADIYGDYSVEALFGEALALQPGLRQRIRLVSKCGIRLTSAQRPTHAIKSYDSSRAHVLASVEHSLRALRTDYLDLLLIHRPDLLMDADELAATFAQLKAAGKVLHVGVSNHTPAQLALLHARHPLATHQVELSPLHLPPLDDGTLEQCQALRLRPMLWSPLAGGRLFGGGDERAERVRAVLADLGRRHGGASVATMAYAWLLRHPTRPWPITGSGREQGLRDAVDALRIELSAQDWYEVWQASAGREVA